MTTQKSILTKIELEKIKKDLLKRKKEINNELNKITKEDKYEHEKHKAIFPEYGEKNDENANEISSFTNNLSLSKSLEKTLIDIEKSLQRIKNKTYGICKYCKNPISKERIKIRPASSACITCKKRFKNKK